MSLKTDEIIEFLGILDEEKENPQNIEDALYKLLQFDSGVIQEGYLIVESVQLKLISLFDVLVANDNFVKKLKQTLAALYRIVRRASFINIVFKYLLPYAINISNLGEDENIKIYKGSINILYHLIKILLTLDKYRTLNTIIKEPLAVYERVLQIIICFKNSELLYKLYKDKELKIDFSKISSKSLKTDIVNRLCTYAINTLEANEASHLIKGLLISRATIKVTSENPLPVNTKRLKQIVAAGKYQLLYNLYKDKELKVDLNQRPKEFMLRVASHLLPYVIKESSIVESLAFIKNISILRREHNNCNDNSISDGKDHIDEDIVEQIVQARKYQLLNTLWEDKSFIIEFSEIKSKALLLEITRIAVSENFSTDAFDAILSAKPTLEEKHGLDAQNLASKEPWKLAVNKGKLECLDKLMTYQNNYKDVLIYVIKHNLEKIFKHLMATFNENINFSSFSIDNNEVLMAAVNLNRFTMVVKLLQCPGVKMLQAVKYLNNEPTNRKKSTKNHNTSTKKIENDKAKIKLYLNSLDMQLRLVQEYMEKADVRNAAKVLSGLCTNNNINSIYECIAQLEKDANYLEFISCFLMELLKVGMANKYINVFCCLLEKAQLENSLFEGESILNWVFQYSHHNRSKLIMSVLKLQHFDVNDEIHPKHNDLLYCVLKNKESDFSSHDYKYILELLRLDAFKEPTFQNRTILIWAVVLDNGEFTGALCDYILKHLDDDYFNVNHLDNDKDTALTHAIKNNNCVFVKWMLNNIPQLKILIITSNGHTAYDLAKKNDAIKALFDDTDIKWKRIVERMTQWSNRALGENEANEYAQLLCEYCKESDTSFKLSLEIIYNEIEFLNEADTNFINFMYELIPMIIKLCSSKIHIENLMEILKEHDLINTKFNKKTVLHLALEAGNNALVKNLCALEELNINASTNTNKFDLDNVTSKLVQKHFKRILKKSTNLIPSKSLNKNDIFGDPLKGVALEVAAQIKTLDLITYQCLIQTKPYSKQEHLYPHIFMTAVKHVNLPFIKVLHELQQKSPNDDILGINNFSVMGFTPLMFAVLLCSPELVQYMLDELSIINTQIIRNEALGTACDLAMKLSTFQIGSKQDQNKIIALFQRPKTLFKRIVDCSRLEGAKHTLPRLVLVEELIAKLEDKQIQDIDISITNSVDNTALEPLEEKYNITQNDTHIEDAVLIILKLLNNNSKLSHYNKLSDLKSSDKAGHFYYALINLIKNIIVHKASVELTVKLCDSGFDLKKVEQRLESTKKLESKEAKDLADALIMHSNVENTDISYFLDEIETNRLGTGSDGGNFIELIKAVIPTMISLCQSRENIFDIINYLKNYDLLNTQFDNKTVLLLAIEAKRYTLVQALCNLSEYDINATMQHVGIYNALDRATVLLLVARYTDLSINYLTTLICAKGVDFAFKSMPHKCTVLIYTAFFDNLNYLLALLAYQVMHHGEDFLSVNHQDTSGLTALMHAVKHGSVIFLEKMLGFPGINLSIKNYQGETAADIAENLIGPPVVVPLASTAEQKKRQQIVNLFNTQVTLFRRIFDAIRLRNMSLRDAPLNDKTNAIVVKLVKKLGNERAQKINDAIAEFIDNKHLHTVEEKQDKSQNNETLTDTIVTIIKQLKDTDYLARCDDLCALKSTIEQNYSYNYLTLAITSIIVGESNLAFYTQNTCVPTHDLIVRASPTHSVCIAPILHAESTDGPKTSCLTLN